MTSGHPPSVPYALRHSFASFAIAAGISLFELARFMGTSVEQIDKTYGHLLPDSLDRTRSHSMRTWQAGVLRLRRLDRSVDGSFGGVERVRDALAGEELVVVLRVTRVPVTIHVFRPREYGLTPSKESLMIAVMAQANPRSRGSEESQLRMRFQLALALLTILALTIVLAFVAALTGSAEKWEFSKELLDVIIPVESGLVGGAMGYYFGAAKS